MKKCPYCAEEIQDEALKCRYCGEFLTREAKVGTTVAPATMQMGGTTGVAAALQVSTGKPRRFPHGWFWLITVVMMFAVGGVGAASDPKLPPAEQQEMAIVGLVAWIVTFVLLGMFTHHLWKKIQDGKTKITPGRAVGFLFIPVFGFIWAAQVWGGYAETLNAFRERHGLAGRASKGITITFTVIWLLGGIMSWTPIAPQYGMIQWILLMVFVAHTGKMTSDLRALGIAYGGSAAESREPVAASYCPQCKRGYRGGFTVCSDCKVPLVAYERLESRPAASVQGGER